MTLRQSNKQTYSLVILAAGIGARFKGGIKQLKQVGPNGQIIMDYSIHDAIAAGFDRIVMIIRKDIEADFRQIIGNRIEAVCAPLGIEVVYAFQDRNDLPEGFSCPPDRIKPWGTGHALLACRELLDGPFVVINADDYYGKSSFVKLLGYLKNLPADSAGTYCLAGFRLGNTLSSYGGVTRGICRTDENGSLRQIKETRHVIRTPDGAAAETPEGLIPLDPNACVSMNMWGFTADLLQTLQTRFIRFLEHKREDSNAEFLLPTIIDHLLADQLVQVQVLPTGSQWFGMTFQEDIPSVVDAFHRLTREGVYTPELYNDLS